MAIGYRSLLALSAATLVAACDSSPSGPKEVSLFDRVVFSRQASDSSFDLYIMKLNGEDVRLLRDSLGLSLVIPRVAPDASRLAVLGFPSAGGTQALYMVSRDGAVQFIPNTFGGGPPSWSPDGTRLVFACVDPAPILGDNTHGICIVNANGTNLQRINHSQYASFMPTWSPDGLRIAFVNDSGGNYDIYSIDLLGHDLQRVTNTPTENEWAPAWSPDGQLLAYSRRTGIDPPSQIYVAQSDGGNQRAVTSLAAGADGPAWSPGGEIGFSSGGQIHAVLPDSTGLHPLTGGAAPAAWPSWGPSGAAVLLALDLH